MFKNTLLTAWLHKAPFLYLLHVVLITYASTIEIDNDERGVIGDFTMINDIRI